MRAGVKCKEQIGYICAKKRLFHLCSKRLRFRYHEDLFEGSGADTGFWEGVMVNY